MAFFRKGVSFEQACERLVAVVAGNSEDDERLSREYADLVPAELGSADWLKREFTVLRLCAILVACKQTRYQDWQARASELFDYVFESAIPLHNKQNWSDFLARQNLGERVHYYTLATHIAKSLGALGREVGESFRMVVSNTPEESLANLGAGVFNRALDQACAIHADYKLVS